jgi:APA family basic amino acid/polyamine antiporter
LSPDHRLGPDLEYSLGDGRVRSAGRIFCGASSRTWGSIPGGSWPPPSLPTLQRHAWSSTGALFNLPAFLIIVVITLLLVIGIRESASVNVVIVFLKITIILIFIGAGMFFIKPGLWKPFIPPNQGQFGFFGTSGILRGAGVMFFAYLGFDAVSTVAQEARNPQRDMPRGILGSLGICTVIYIVFSLVLTGVVPYTELNVAAPVAVAIDAMRLLWLSPLIKIAAVVGLIRC